MLLGVAAIGRALLTIPGMLYVVMVLAGFVLIQESLAAFTVFLNGPNTLAIKWLEFMAVIWWKGKQPNPLAFAVINSFHRDL